MASSILSFSFSFIHINSLSHTYTRMRLYISPRESRVQHHNSFCSRFTFRSYICAPNCDPGERASQHWPGYYRLSGRFVMTPEAAILVLSAAHYMYLVQCKGSQDSHSTLGTHQELDLSFLLLFVLSYGVFPTLHVVREKNFFYRGWEKPGVIIHSFSFE